MLWFSLLNLRLLAIPIINLYPFWGDRARWRYFIVSSIEYIYVLKQGTWSAR